MPRPLFALLLVLGVLAPVRAAPLATLAPAESFAVLGWHEAAPSEGAERLAADLRALDWARAARTVRRLERAAALDMEPRRETLLRELNAACPALRTSPPLSAAEALFTVSATPYNPLPALTALLRSDPGDARAFAELQREVVRCAERRGLEVLRFSEGAAPLFVVGNAGDFPLIVGRFEEVFVIGTNPQVVRGVLRRAQGAAEPNLAQMGFYRQNQALLEGGAVSALLNTAALAEALESLGGPLVSPATEPLFRRGVAALRTLGGYAGSLHLEDDALRFESRLGVDARGGDPDLARLLLDAPPAPTLTLAPATSTHVYSTALQLEPLFAYLEGWLGEVGAATGTPLSLRARARSELGLDLDAALFDWLGDGATHIVLEPLGNTLQGLIYGPAQVLALETRGGAATRAGLKALDRALQRALERGALGPEPGGSALTQSVRDSYRYGGVRITRLRVGPTTDFGAALLGSTLLLGTPARSLERVIGVAQGHVRPLTEDDAFAAFQETAPAPPVQLSYSALGLELESLAALTRLGAQPLAFAATAALSDNPAAAPGFADLLHLSELLPDTLEVVSEHVATLTGRSWVYGPSRRFLLQLELR